MSVLDFSPVRREEATSSQDMNIDGYFLTSCREQYRLDMALMLVVYQALGSAPYAGAALLKTGLTAWRHEHTLCSE